MHRDNFTVAAAVGAELQDGAAPSPDHDIFVLTRPNGVEVGCCSPKTAVTFREPGKTVFQLELPLNAPLKDIKATLLSATRLSRRQRDGNGVGEEVVNNRTDGHDARDCTLIIGGKKMLNFYLLGDYLLMKNAMRRTPTILVLWHPLRQGPAKSTAAATRVPRFSLPPADSFAAAVSAPLPIQSLGEGRWGRYLRSRRSVKRQCKGAVRFSGLKRGARCGLGIQPLS